ncbi:MAG: hypothetical protein Q9222_003235 [Ikaeria aurantiellina]
MFQISRTLRQPLFRSLRPSFSSSPVSCRSYIQHSGPLRVQHVKISRAKRARKFFGSTSRNLAYLGLIYVALGLLLDDDEEDERISESQNVDKLHELKNDPDTAETEEKDTEDEDDTIFIPLGFAYKLPQQYYKGSDPEWQSFVELARDKKRCDLLKNQLTGIIGSHVGALPPIEKALGKGNQPRKFWLDIDFPDGPPPEYERKGLEISDDHVAWTTRPVHPLHYTKLQKALWPTSLASSMWASYKTMASLQYAKLRGYLKPFSDPQASSSESAEGPDLSLQDMHQKTTPQTQKSPSTSEGEDSTKKSDQGEASDQASTRAPTSDFSRLLPSYPGLPSMNDDMTSAMSAFKKTFAQTWRPASTPPERGTVMFSGMVELVGPKGVAVLDVRGIYHAAESRWTNVGIAVRRIQSKKQSPRGGR